MRVLVTGAAGMLGRTLMDVLSHHECVPLDIDDCDITHAKEVTQYVGDIRPDTVIHCAAMTAVDACETREDDAFRVNAIGSGNVAAACRRLQARLIALSTDYVFAGDLDRPYHEWDHVGPASIYGQSKWAGEQLIRQLCPNHLIARVAWLYGPGGPSFLHTMVRLATSGQTPLNVVDDQCGNPTSTYAVARHLALLLETPIAGTVHLTCEGEITWYGLTCELFRLLGRRVEVAPCRTDEFPRPAPRPANSRLENRVLRLHGLPPMPHWQEALSDFAAREWQ